jgi:hypothetical protein
MSPFQNTMPPSPDAFDSLQSALSTGGVDAVLQQLAALLREQHRYHDLFEVRKMQIRRGLGLPPLYQDTGDGLDDRVGKQLEEGLLAACREIGAALLDQGRVREGWMYLRPVGDKAGVAARIRELPVTDANADELIEVAFYESVDVEQGFGLMLARHGTCNSITAMESAGHQMSKADRQKAIALLVRHVHQELIANVVADIATREGFSPPATTLRELSAPRDWLFGEHSYHIDTTHLAATVRFAEVLTDPAALRLALDLTEYGRRLNAQFQYPGDEPFAVTYPSRALFFAASLGERVDEALDYFQRKAESIDAYQVGAMSIEVYVELLARLGRYDEAIQAAISLMPDNVHHVGFAPSLMELAQRAGRYDRVLQYCRKRNDILGFATALAHSGA